MRILKTRSIIRQLLPTTSQILITSKFLIFSIRITHSYITISRATPLKFSFDLSRERYNSAQTRPPSVNGNIKKTWKRGEKLIVLPRCLQPPPHPPFHIFARADKRADSVVQPRYPRHENWTTLSQESH